MGRKNRGDGFDNFRRLDRILGHLLDVVKFFMWLVVLLVLAALIFYWGRPVGL